MPRQPISSPSFRQFDPDSYPADPYAGLAWGPFFVLFRPMERHPGYAVDTAGNVWSCKRKTPPYGVADSWRLVSQTIVNDHSRVNLYAGRRMIMRGVHQLVLDTFVGPCPPGLQGLHINGHGTDNRLCNLRWGTHRENCEDAKRHGTWTHGEKHWAATIGEADVPRIFEMRSKGVRIQDIADNFGVARSVIKGVLEGITWRHIPRPPDWDRIAPGLSRVNQVRGERAGAAKVEPGAIAEIRRLVSEGISQRELGRRFGLSKSQVGRIARNEAWQHI